MNRRGFLSTLLAGPMMDPERAIWVPNRKMISIPKPRPVLWHDGFTLSMVGISTQAMRSLGLLYRDQAMSAEALNHCCWAATKIVKRGHRISSYALAMEIAPDCGLNPFQRRISA